MRLREEELERLYREYSTPLYRFALAMLGSHDEAMDIVADTFERASMEPRLDDPGFNARAWLFKVAGNRGKSLLTRFFRRFITGVDLSSFPSKNFELQVEVERREAFASMARAVRRLSYPDRTVIYLKYFESMSSREISEATGMAEGTVTSRLSRAIKRLKNEINN